MISQTTECRWKKESVEVLEPFMRKLPDLFIPTFEALLKMNTTTTLAN